VDPATVELAAERYETARQAWTLIGPKTNWQTPEECETWVSWSRRLAEAAADSGAMPRQQAFAEHVARLQGVLTTTQDLYEAGRRTVVDIAIVRFHLAEAKALSD
jgi:hypothetical protein